MNTNNRSLGQALTSLFGTVATLGNAVSTGVAAGGNLFEELERRSSSRLRTVEADIFLTEQVKVQGLIIQTAAIQDANVRQLQSDPGLAAAYARLEASLHAHLKPAAPTVAP